MKAGRSVSCADLDHILDRTRGLWEEFRSQRIFITGGTGFFGCWLLESFAWANHKLNLNAQALVLTRDPAAFEKKVPHRAECPAIRFHEGDVRSFEFPEGSFSHILHLATKANAKYPEEDKSLTLDTIVEGTRRTLEFAGHCKADKLLFVSSGAVYGKQPPDVTHVPEDYAGKLDPTSPAFTYGKGKQLAEDLCTSYAKKHGLAIKIARCFTFVGPYQSLDGSFAVADFIRDGLEDAPIRVRGDGTDCRSYLYAADLAVWLWMILLKGNPGQAYNVGSDKAVSIKELAYAVSRATAHNPRVTVAKSSRRGGPREQYVPSIEKARRDLGLECWIDLDTALRKTIEWHQRKKVV